MSRIVVQQMRCDRCKRVMIVSPVENKMPDFVISYFGRELRYDDVCERCKPSLLRAVEYAQEWEREVKQAFGPQVGPDQAVPVSTQPDYTPQQPHSRAAAKR